MKRKLIFIPIFLILLLSLQYGNQNLNTNSENRIGNQQRWIMQTDYNSLMLDKDFDFATPTTVEGKLEVGSQIISRSFTSVAEWQPPIVGYQGEVISRTGEVAYVYMSDFAAANSYKGLLEANGYPTTLIPIQSITEGIFDDYDLIILADDTGWNKYWGTDPSQATIVYNSGKRVLGLGEGGYAYFGQVDLYIGSSHGNQGVHGNLDSIVVVDDTHLIFNSPNSIDSGTIQLYNYDSRQVSIHFSTTPEDVVLLGQEPASEHYPIVLEKGRYLLWGFRESVDMMTQTGKDLMVNVISYLSGHWGPIYIDSNDDFNTYGFPGDGTENNPYIIGGYRIIDTTATLIHIQDTTAYFIVKNNLLDGIEGIYDGIYLLRVTHGTISDNNIHNCNIGVFLSASNENKITNNLITNNRAHGVYIQHSNNNVIEYNTISDSGALFSSESRSINGRSIGHGIWLNPSTQNTISNNEIYNSNGDGVYLDGSNDNTISENSIHHNKDLTLTRGRSIGHGIWLNPSLGNNINGNDVYANGESGIGLLLSNDTSIVDNFVHENEVTGVTLQYSNYNTIDQNFIGMNGAGSTRGSSIGHGIWLNPSTYNTISNNEIYNNNGDGVYLDHSNDNTISGNDIHHNKVLMPTRGRSIGHGIWLNPSLGNTITGNDVYANGESGIGLLQSNYTMIANNTVYENEATGVNLQYSHYNTIDQNSIGVNGAGSTRGGSIGHGIWLNPSTHNTISNNDIYNNNGDGVYLDHSNENTISGNAIHHNKNLTLTRGSSIGHGIWLNPSLGNTITGNDIYANGESGIGLLLSNYTTIANNTVYENEATGVNLQYSHYNTIDQNSIGTNGAGSTRGGSIGHGIWLNPSTHNTISNNEIYSNNGDGVYLDHSNENTISGNTIHHNKVRIPTRGRSIGHGIWLNPSLDNKITSNNVYANGESGIGLYLSNHTTIVDNYVHENEATGVTLQYSNYNTIDQNFIGENGAGSTRGSSIGHGIWLNPSTHNTISNNEIYNNNGDGVYLDHSNENVISGNAIHHNSNINRGRSIGHGIWLNPSLGNTIIDNDVYANGESGIGLLQSNETIIADNLIHDNGENGVSLQYSNDNFIDSNIITQNGVGRRGRSIGHGIWLNPSHNNVILNNTVSNNQGTGLTLYQSSNTTTYSNTISNNSLYGVNITLGADDNAIALNNFLNNYPNGTAQATDDGVDNLFLYNHWNDHDNTDGDGNNIADDPDPIDGNANSEDIAGVATIITETGDYLMPPIILFPNYHDKVTGYVDVQWLMAIDSYGHDITYDFWYSPNAGKDWILEATGLTETNYLWDTNDFKSGSRYKIKIVATCSEGESTEAISGKFEIFKIKKTGFPNPDNKLPATDLMTTTTATATAGSLIGVVLSMGVVISIRRFRRQF